MYNYYKQVSRRRHQYGDADAMSLIPLTPLDHTGAVPAYKAGVDAMASDSAVSLDAISEQFQAQENSKGKAKARQHQLPPLATNAATAPGEGKGRRGLGSRESAGGDGEPKGGGNLSKAQGDGDVGIQRPVPRKGSCALL